MKNYKALAHDLNIFAVCVIFGVCAHHFVGGMAASAGGAVAFLIAELKPIKEILERFLH